MMVYLVVGSLLSCKKLLTLSITQICKKLEHYGVRGTVLNWFTGYLSDRSQYVSVNSYTSDHLKIT